MEIGRGRQILLHSVSELTWNPRRSSEPVTIGIPMPSGFLKEAGGLQLHDATGGPVPLQVQILDRWADGSARWALLDFQIDAPVSTLRVTARAASEPAVTPGTRIRVTKQDPLTIDTGAATFTFGPGTPFPVGDVSIGAHQRLESSRSGTFIAANGAPIRPDIASATVVSDGPLRTVVHIRPWSADLPPGLEVSARVELFAGLAAARVHVTIANTRAARHEGGQWPLGDPESILLKSAACRFGLTSAALDVSAAAEFGQPAESFPVPFELYQESSGGPAWNGPVHKNRDGAVPQRQKGYRLQGGASERSGLRASPIVTARTSAGSLGLAVPQFWENCPRAISVRDDVVEFAFLPGAFPDLHELQAGERKTHSFVVDFVGNADALAWCHDPLVFCPDAEWTTSSGVVPFFSSARDDDQKLAGLIAAGLDEQTGFVAKREKFDEYGWRHFGDLPADHESAFQPPGTFFISHYNNQYDAIATFAIQFLRSGDARWWRLMQDLARHVRDIDIYRTDHDKAAYCYGLFWHTTHYTDAGTSTHRAYPRGGPGGGGPSAEHNYNAGLMLHYFLTGETDSKSAAIDLGRWVLAMDDGHRTVFRYLAGGATGLASSTASTDYHGPGRGAGNSILACMTAHRLTGDSHYLDKARELIRRCAGPRDDFDALNLRHIESRWSYTVFLQVLALFLHDRLQSGARSADESYVRDTLLHYARWMAANERPYLDRVEELEFPTETWAAQDLRKADVFGWAARLATGAERDLFLAKARSFYEYAVTELSNRPTRTFTRPLILVLANGSRARALQNAPPIDRDAALPALAATAPRRGFEPQKSVAIRRAKLLAVAGALAVVGGLLWMAGVFS